MNRRDLFGRLAAIAAVVAVAPAFKVDAAPGPQIPDRKRYPGDTDLSRRCVTCGWHVPWKNRLSTHEELLHEIAAFERHTELAHGGYTQPTEGVWRPHQEDDLDSIPVVGCDACQFGQYASCHGACIEHRAAQAQARVEGYERGRVIEQESGAIHRLTVSGNSSVPGFLRVRVGNTETTIPVYTA